MKTEPQTSHYSNDGILREKSAKENKPFVKKNQSQKESGYDKYKLYFNIAYTLVITRIYFILTLCLNFLRSIFFYETLILNNVPSNWPVSKNGSIDAFS